MAGDVKVAKTTLNIPYPYEDGMAEVWINTHIDSFNKSSDITGGNVSINNPEEISEIEWVDISKANKLMPYHESGIEQLVYNSAIYTYQN